MRSEKKDEEDFQTQLEGRKKSEIIARQKKRKETNELLIFDIEPFYAASIMSCVYNCTFKLSRVISHYITSSHITIYVCMCVKMCLLLVAGLCTWPLH